MYAEGTEYDKNYIRAEMIKNHIQKRIRIGNPKQKQDFVGEFHDKRLSEISTEIMSLQ